MKSVARALGRAKIPIVRMRPRGYTPHGRYGVDCGNSIAVPTTGGVRTRIEHFEKGMKSLQVVPCAVMDGGLVGMLMLRSASRFVVRGAAGMVAPQDQAEISLLELGLVTRLGKYERLQH